MSLNPIKGKVTPIRDHVLITNMSFEEQRTNWGLVIQSDDGKSEGIKPRWGKVWAVGPAQTDIKVGEWILVEHGRWTRGFDIESEDGTTTTVRRVDVHGIIMTADQPSNEITFGLATPQHGSIFDPSDFTAPMYEGQRG
jgi:co-chaperonin GroES (HSP10)